MSFPAPMNPVNLFKFEEDYKKALCVCGHPQEYHGPCMAGEESHSHCNECGCLQFEDANESIDPYEQEVRGDLRQRLEDAQRESGGEPHVPLCLNCRTLMSPVAEKPGMFTCTLCTQAVRV